VCLYHIQYVNKYFNAASTGSYQLKECLMKYNGTVISYNSTTCDEDPAVMERKTNLAKRLELYQIAQSEIDAVAWSK
jgi:hypothetical protein